MACVNEETITAGLERQPLETRLHGISPSSCHRGGKPSRQGNEPLGHEGLIKRWIGGIAIASPALAKLIEADKCEAYNLPQGVIAATVKFAAKRPGLITKVGMGTFVDPRSRAAGCLPRASTTSVR